MHRTFLRDMTCKLPWCSRVLAENGIANHHDKNQSEVRNFDNQMSLGPLYVMCVYIDVSTYLQIQPVSQLQTFPQVWCFCRNSHKRFVTGTCDVVSSKIPWILQLHGDGLENVTLGSGHGWIDISILEIFGGLRCKERSAHLKNIWFTGTKRYT